MKNTYNSKGKWLCSLVLVVLWPLVTVASDPDEYLSDAQEYFEKGEFSAAVIQLKNALLVEPDNEQARLLLGQAYLELQNGTSAYKELKRAKELGASRETVLVPMGRALLMSGRIDELLKSVFIEREDPDSLKANIFLLQGQAHLAKQNFKLADDKFSRALELDSSMVDATLGKARIAYHSKEYEKVSVFVDRALSLEPGNADAWVMRAELLGVEGQTLAAMTAFEKALDIAPDNVVARAGKASMLIRLGKPDKALLEIDGLEQQRPNIYLVHYLRALALYQKQQLDKARDSVQLALGRAPDNLQSHLLAGTIAFQQGQLNQAEQHLRLYYSQIPESIQATKLLAAVLIKLKQPAQAIEVMEPGATAASEDPQYLSMLGSAYLALGDGTRGMEYLEKAIALKPDIAVLRLQLALGMLVEGDVDEAINALQVAVELDQTLYHADLLQVILYLENEDFQNALAVAESMVMKMPENPVPLNLRGAAQLGKGDLTAARRDFEAALKIQEEFLPAHMNLGQLELLNGNIAKAESRYRKVLLYDAVNLKAMLALAALAEGEGKFNEELKWLKLARDNHPDENKPALMLVEHYLRKGDTERALYVARDMAVAKPRDPYIQHALAMSQLRAGEYEAAIGTLRSLVEVAPMSSKAHYLLAAVQLKLDKKKAARASLQQALELQADYPAAQMALARLEISEKNYDVAGDIASSLHQVHPDTSYGDEINGDIHTAREAFQQAADTYEQAYGKVPSSQLAAKLFHSRAENGETEVAREALRAWLDEQPDDITIRRKLADSLLTNGLNTQAIGEYQLILENAPDDVTALNNIAWLYQEAGDAAGLKYAQRAHELAPDSPEITDTLGWLLLQNGETNRGLVLLQEARVKAPHIPEIHYHMAVALYKSGRIDESRKELDRLLKMGKTFPQLDDARALRDKLVKQ